MVIIGGLAIAYGVKAKDKGEKYAELIIRSILFLGACIPSFFSTLSDF